LHQEDFCQALGVAPEYKYQNEGGPGLVQAFVLLRSATRPSAPHTLKLLDYVMFNALIGNHDAHGKNFSLLYTTAGVVLTPLYDVLCTAVYPRLTDKMAMKIGSKYKFSEVQSRHWEQFATEAVLSPAQVKKRMMDIAKRLPDLARTTQAVFQSQGNIHPIIDPIITLIDQRCALTIRRLT
jgi:serine/threonine-protein kinase HipA